MGLSREIHFWQLLIPFLNYSSSCGLIVIDEIKQDAFDAVNVGGSKVVPPSVKDILVLRIKGN